MHAIEYSNDHHIVSKMMALPYTKDIDYKIKFNMILK